MKHKSLLVGLLVGLLIFSSVGFAYAEQRSPQPQPALSAAEGGVGGMPPLGRGEPRGTLIEGEVTAIEGATLTVATQHRGEISVQTDADTKFRARDNADFSLANIQVGDTIAAKGRFIDESTLAARVVMRAPAELADTAHGKVTAIEGDTIIVEDKDGNVTHIVTSADTRFHFKGNPDASIEDIAVGMSLGAAGQFDANGALIAQRVMAGELREPRRRGSLKGAPLAGGRVAEVHGDEFVINYPDGSTLTVATDASTLVITHGEEGPALGSLSDVSEGARILAIGVPSEDGSSLAARVIMVGLGRHAGSPQPAGPLQP